MLTVTSSKKTIASIGEEIGLELGKQMVQDFQIANPKEIQHYTIGKNIISEILAQPGCEGIRFYMAYNEIGEKTMVYVGLDSDGKAIITYTTINKDGNLEQKPAIVADRIDRGGPTEKSGYDADSWTWETE
jgi:hypothetical protein